MAGNLTKLPPPPANKSGWPWTEETPPSVYASHQDWPRISIITPSFNQVRFVEETIRSVLLQNYPNLQFIIIDGGSSDGSKQIIESYREWIDYWVSEPDGGQSDAINKGLKIADGEWRNWLNSDDSLMTKALHSIASAAIECAARPALITGSLSVLNDSGETTCAPKLGLDRPNEEQLVNHRVAQPAMFYQASWLARVDPALHMAMDYALWVQFIAAVGPKQVVELNETVAQFRVHAASKTSLNQAAFEQEERIILRELSRRMGSASSFLKALYPEPGIVMAFKIKTLHRRTLEKVLTRRYLLGDYRRNIRRGYSSLHLGLVCFTRLPWQTLSTFLKETIKRTFAASRHG